MPWLFKKYPKIFLSHNISDKPFVRRLAHDLEICGISCWVDEAEMRPGDSLLGKIGEAVKDVDYLGVILSPNSIQSEWVQREVAIALTQEIHTKRVKVIPILFKACSIPPFLLDKLYVDFSKSKDYVKALRTLIRGCGGNIDVVSYDNVLLPEGIMKTEGGGATFYYYDEHGQYIPAGIIPLEINTRYLHMIYAIGEYPGYGEHKREDIVLDLFIPPDIFPLYSTIKLESTIKEIRKAYKLPKVEDPIRIFDPNEYGEHGGIEVYFCPLNLSIDNIQAIIETLLKVHNSEIERLRPYEKLLPMD